MAIPISYNLRNLAARRATTIMTALGIALTVAVLLAVSAMVEGLRVSLETGGHPLNLLVMRKGATAELNSVVTRETFSNVKFKPGIARDAKGEPLVSLELVTVVVLESPENPAGININVRGVSEQGMAMREGAKLIEGRMFTPGRREVVVGKGIAGRYPMARLGQKIEFGRGFWEVVGVLDAGRGVANSEIFCDVGQIASDQNREQALSTVLIRANSESELQALANNIGADQKINADTMTERDYNAQQTSSAAPLQYVGTFAAVIMAVGSCFAAMNTMYAAVARRSAEIGTLRVLGFSRTGILVSFFIESLLLSLLGGILGCVLVLPLNNLSAGIGSFVTFSEITFEFRVTPRIMAGGIAFGLAMGAIGGLFPAASAARKQILAALRQV